MTQQSKKVAAKKSSSRKGLGNNPADNLGFNDPEVKERTAIAELLSQNLTPMKVDNAVDLDHLQRRDVEVLKNAIEGEERNATTRLATTAIMMIRFHFNPFNEDDGNPVLAVYETEDSKARAALWLELLERCFVLGSVSEDGKKLVVDATKDAPFEKKIKKAAQDVLPFVYRVCKFGSLSDVAVDENGALCVKGKHYYVSANKPTALMRNNWISLSGTATGKDPNVSSVAQAIKFAKAELNKGSSGGAVGGTITFESALSTSEVKLRSCKSYESIPKASRGVVDRMFAELIRLYDLSNTFAKLQKWANDPKAQIPDDIRSDLKQLQSIGTRVDGKAKGDIADDGE